MATQRNKGPSVQIWSLCGQPQLLRHDYKRAGMSWWINAACTHVSVSVHCLQCWSSSVDGPVEQWGGGMLQRCRGLEMRKNFAEELWNWIYILMYVKPPLVSPPFPLLAGTKAGFIWIGFWFSGVLVIFGSVCPSMLSLDPASSTKWAPFPNTEFT